ncbi:MAG: hypothetical protein VKK04_13930 [Synechococcales bacterium]|nr:hypothetical protein [Synechococcales bacterium]
MKFQPFLQPKLLCYFMVGMTVAIAACTSQPPRSSSTHPISADSSAASSMDETPSTAPAPDVPGEPGPTDWATLLGGDATADLTFTNNGELALGEQVLLDAIPVSYTSDSAGTPATYASRLLVSPPSPSGRYTIVKACDDPNPGMGLCWAAYIIDRQEAIAQRVSIGKYGGQEWLQWSPDERYAVFLEKLEGTSWFVVLDLEIGESLVMDELPAEADLSQFAWTGDRTFSAPLANGSTFEGDLAALFPGY